MPKQLYNECADIEIIIKSTRINRLSGKTGKYQTIFTLMFDLLDSDGNLLEVDGKTVDRQTRRKTIINKKARATNKEVLVAEQTAGKNFINSVGQKHAGKDIIIEGK